MASAHLPSASTAATDQLSVSPEVSPEVKAKADVALNQAFANARHVMLADIDRKLVRYINYEFNDPETMGAVKFSEITDETQRSEVLKKVLQLPVSKFITEDGHQIFGDREHKIRGDTWQHDTVYNDTKLEVMLRQLLQFSHWGGILVQDMASITYNHFPLIGAIILSQFPNDGNIALVSHILAMRHQELMWSLPEPSVPTPSISPEELIIDAGFLELPDSEEANLEFLAKLEREFRQKPQGEEEDLLKYDASTGELGVNDFVGNWDPLSVTQK
jgi:hypothetical protein